MVDINFNKAISKSKNILTSWKKRYLTPIGKITVIKTFIISMFNHLFISLPTPKFSTIKKISDLVYEFLWDKKPDKISRNLITQDLLNGGLKMINLQNFIISLKCTWIRRLLKGNNAAWISIFGNIKIAQNLSIFGPQWCRLLKQKIRNPFWLDVFDSWQIVSDASILKSGEDILSSPLWYNKNIAKYTLYLQNWHDKGILYVKDLLDSNGNFLSSTALSTNYGFHVNNFLDYYKIKILVNKFLLQNNFDPTSMKNLEYHLLLPQHLKILYKSSKGSRDMYNIINKQNFEPKMKKKWDKDFNIIIDKITWRNIFKACFKVVTNSPLIWLQYRLLNRILGVRKYLCILKIENNETCRLCSNNIETLIHLFSDCVKSQELWSCIKSWIKEVVKFELNLSAETIILGYLNTDTNFEPINLILLVTKHYLFNCASQSKMPRFHILKNRIKQSFAEQQMIARINSMEHAFDKNWSRWRPLFQDI